MDPVHRCKTAGSPFDFDDMKPIDLDTAATILYEVTVSATKQKNYLVLRREGFAGSYRQGHDYRDSGSFVIGKTGMIAAYWKKDWGSPAGALVKRVHFIPFFNSTRPEDYLPDNEFMEADALSEVDWSAEKYPNYPPLCIVKSTRDNKWHLLNSYAGAKNPYDSFSVKDHKLFLYKNKTWYHYQNNELIPSAGASENFTVERKTNTEDVWVVKKQDRSGIYNLVTHTSVVPVQYKNITLEERNIISTDPGTNQLVRDTVTLVYADSTLYIFDKRMSRKILESDNTFIDLNGSTSWGFLLQKKKASSFYDFSSNSILFEKGADQIIPGIIDKKPVYIVREHSSFGLYNGTGTRLMEPVYENLQILKPHFIAFKKMGKYGAYDLLQQKEICKPIYDKITIVAPDGVLSDDFTPTLVLQKNGVISYLNPENGLATNENEVVLKSVTMSSGYRNSEPVTLTQQKNGKWVRKNDKMEFDDFTRNSYKDYCLVKGTTVERHILSNFAADKVLRYQLPEPSCKVADVSGLLLTCKTNSGKWGLLAPGKTLIFPDAVSMEVKYDSMPSNINRKMFYAYHISCNVQHTEVRIFLLEDNIAACDPYAVNYKSEKEITMTCPVCGGTGRTSTSISSTSTSRTKGTYTDYETVTDAYGNKRVIAVQKESSFNDKVTTQSSTSSTKTSCSRCNGAGSYTDREELFLKWKENHYTISKTR